MRLVKPAGKTYDVTDAVQKVAQEFSCIPVEGESYRRARALSRDAGTL